MQQFPDSLACYPPDTAWANHTTFVDENLGGGDVASNVLFFLRGMKENIKRGKECTGEVFEKRRCGVRCLLLP